MIIYSIHQENSVSGWWRSSCDLSKIVNESTKQGIIIIIIIIMLLLLSVVTCLLPDPSSHEPTVILTAQTSSFSLLHFPALSLSLLLFRVVPSFNECPSARCATDANLVCSDSGFHCHM
jgi:hypothetical protein